MEKLEGKTAFVTGAAGGIGLGLAKTFARAGMNIVIADIQDKQLKVAESELQEITDNVLALVVDTTDTGSIENAAEKVENTFGNLHVLCNNAGIGGGGKILETDQETWDRVFNVNFQGPLNGVNQFLPHMLEHGEESHIVNTASFSGIEGHGHQSAYGSSKFAMVGFSEFLRNDLAGTNVGVSVLCPHVVDTPIIANLKKRVDEKIAAMISDMAVPAETVGAQVMKAILGNEFYVFCDGTHTRKMLENRCSNLIASMDRQFPQDDR
ncbi:MAG: SDR family NAD(P)-dependent oxidoreductase [Proteobacteria bacterium]|jgi:NAD(P)-dependent dehydrogenase (short-subunit alcohol dehydrogenase family)|nr:SDR family NAD(P)-dependent oxidoreductase [Pseudomonadota bacterium]MBT6350041.1 SDR family NAD(P)-dependent oxidoreductase [Pseudomonadota bacterium]